MLLHSVMTVTAARAGKTIVLLMTPSETDLQAAFKATIEPICSLLHGQQIVRPATPGVQATTPRTETES